MSNASESTRAAPGGTSLEWDPSMIERFNGDARFHAGFHHAPIGMAILDPGGDVQLANRSFCRMIGYECAELIGRGFISLTHPEDRVRSQLAVEHARRGDGLVQDLEKRYVHRSGQTILARTNATLVRNATGKPAFWIAQVQDVTEAREIEAALRSGEEDLHRLLENMPVMLHAVDEAGRVLVWNRECELVTGYLASEVVGRPDTLECMYPDRAYRARWIDAWRGPREASRHEEWRVCCKDGRERAILWSDISTDHPVPGWARWGIGVDVSNLKAAEDSVRQQARILDQVHDSVISIDLRGRITSWNLGAERLYGWPAAEARGRPVAFLFPKADRVGLNARLIRPLLEAGRLERLVRQVTRDGREIETHLALTVQQDEAGEVVGIIGSSHDVTERLWARRQIESRDRQQDVLNELGRIALKGDAPGGLLQQAATLCAQALDVPYLAIFENLREEHQLLLRAGVGWNAASLGTTVLPLDEDCMVGFTLAHGLPVVTDEFRDEGRFRGVPLPEARAVASGACVPIAGSEHPYGALCVLSPRPLSFGRNDVLFLQSVAVLLATAVERHRTEQALRASEAQLLEAQKLESIGRLAGGVAHDFNNLLLVITGYAGLLERKFQEHDPRCREVQAISEAADRAAGLTRQLLAFSRRQVLQPRVLDLNGVAADVLGMLERTIGEDIKLVTELDPDLGCVRTDPGQMEQVLLNLAVNARDAMPGGGRLCIRTKNVVIGPAEVRRYEGLSPGPHAQLSVEDTGHGMDADTASHVFEPFFTTKRRGKGTGLGLSTVYGIVKQSDGHIDVRSAPGTGTCMSVFLPVAAAAADPVIEATQARGDLEGTETILIAEDEDEIRDLAKRILREFGYHVLGASDGARALDSLREYPEPIHLLITDVVMPRMSGTELARHARDLRPEMEILYVSGYADRPEFVGRDLSDGAELLRKPFRPLELVARARALLDARTAAEG